MLKDLIFVSPTSDRSMYLQIMDQMKRLIAAGVFKPGDEIPSIRALAVELHISVITVKRAYLELERSGVITTQQGRGCFVTRRLPQLDLRLKQEEMRQFMRLGAESARALGLHREEAGAEFNRIYDSLGGQDE